VEGEGGRLMMAISSVRALRDGLLGDGVTECTQASCSE